MPALRVDLPYACYTLVVDQIHPYGIITRAPPIANWMVGKCLREIEEWVIRRHGTIMMEAQDKE